MQKVLAKQQERSKRSDSNHQVVNQVAENCINSQESRKITISNSNHAIVVMMSDKVVYQFGQSEQVLSSPGFCFRHSR